MKRSVSQTEGRKSRRSKFCTVRPNVFKILILNLLDVTLAVSRAMGWPPKFWKIFWLVSYNYVHVRTSDCLSQWPRGLRRSSLAARVLRLSVRIPPGAWMFACCECCVLSGRGLCDGLIIRSVESYRMWRVVVCDQETSQTRRLKPTTRL